MSHKKRARHKPKYMKIVAQLENPQEKFDELQRKGWTSLHGIDKGAENRELFVHPKAPVLYGFEVDKRHANGNEYHFVRQDASVYIYNAESEKFITILLAREGQIEKYPGIPTARDAEAMGSAELIALYTCSNLNWSSYANQIDHEYLLLNKDAEIFFDKAHVLTHVGLDVKEIPAYNIYYKEQELEQDYKPDYEAGGLEL